MLESSRRARIRDVGGAARPGRSGVADLVDRCCARARRLGDGLAALDGVDVVNDVVLNQVLVRVGDAEDTNRIERAIQQEGVLWLGATTWGGERLLRIAVSNWSTTARSKLGNVDAATTRLKLRVSPGARRPGIAGRHGDAWKIRVAEPPEDGRANEAVLRLLAQTLDLPRASVSLVSGHAARDKIVTLDGLEQSQTERLLADAERKG